MTEFRPARFELLPLVIKNLLIINGLVFLAQRTIGASLHLDDLFALHTFQSELFRPWQFVTYMFLHGSFSHIFSNMLALWMFGAVLENLWGPKRFLTFFLVCGLGAALCHMIALYFENAQMLKDYAAVNQESPNYFSQVKAFAQKYTGTYDLINPASIKALKLDEATVGASGAVFGCLAAFGYLFPNTYIYLYFFIPLKAKWFVILYAVGELALTIRASAGDNIAHIAHLGGALFGFILVYYWNKTNKRTFY